MNKSHRGIIDLGTNYLKKFYLSDEKLAQRARLEFYRALETGRMIAFVGSMATEAMGYGKWRELNSDFADCADEVLHEVKSGADQSEREALERAETGVGKFRKYGPNNYWSDVVGMRMIEEVLDQPELAGLKVPTTPSNAWPLDRANTLREDARVRFAKKFRVPSHEVFGSAGTSLGIADVRLREHDVPHLLWHRLGIRRFATTNYDFELERVAMVGEASLENADLKVFETLRDHRRRNDIHRFDWDLGSGRIRRVHADGWAIESDMVNRERIDRMIEFAAGTDDVNGHIMHLHGRACNWRSMIVTQRDYDLLYRGNDLNRLPFEFARRMLMGGNPMLFVGLGMSEDELNRELREFISNSPYHRAAPTFLLWNASEMTEENRSARRLDLLTRLGVLIIYDTDLGLTASTKDPLLDLGNLVSAAAPNLSGTNDHRTNPLLRERHIGKQWRSMRGRVISAGSGEPIVLWRTMPAPTGFQDTTALVERLMGASILAVIGPQGCGKGAAAAALQALAKETPEKLHIPSANRFFQINGGFSFDTDTLLDGVAHFLDNALGSGDWKPSTSAPPRCSRSKLFRELGIGDASKAGQSGEALIVINGMERFFGIEGRPLSSELDEFLRILMKTPIDCEGPLSPAPRVRLLLLGTERIRPYCQEIDAKTVEFREDYRNSNATSPTKPGVVPGGYLASVWHEASSRGVAHTPHLQSAISTYWANGAGRISGDSILLRQALFDTLFDEANFNALVGNVAEPPPVATVRLAREILRALAFVGAPVERDVLARMPSISRQSSLVGEALTCLQRAKLVVTLAGYVSQGEAAKAVPRYALHRSLLTELRYRFGIPLNEAKLSTAFNMSLYVAQPIDGDIPDVDIHDELGAAIDTLIGSYLSQGEHLSSPHDAFEHSFADRAERLKVIAYVAGACGHTGSPTAEATIVSLCSEGHVQALRAALALIRSYYSTTGLLTLDSGDRLTRIDRDGILLEHAERLDALIDAYGKVSLAREAMREQFLAVARKTSTGEAAEVSATKSFHAVFGSAEPFYPDELVWLHNERGVVRLAMGDLYEAKRSFDQAMAVNRQWVERDDRGHNWRRIRLNQLTLEMELGELGLVDRMCEELELLSRTKLQEHRHPPSWCEDELALGIVLGHRGWCQHLRGDSAKASASYAAAHEIFSRLKETRAQAYFMRLAAGLPNAEVTHQRRVGEIENARHIAQSARQMDIVHRIQVTLADAILFGDKTKLRGPAETQKANRLLEEALAYAIQADVHRVRCEASMTIARSRLRSADYEGALRYAMDAMMVATRYGMELRKISLRALVAQVMVARGHPVTAERLARTCIKMATRKRFQTALSKAENVILEIPRVSASISRSDGSGRRDF